MPPADIQSPIKELLLCWALVFTMLLPTLVVHAQTTDKKTDWKHTSVQIEEHSCNLARALGALAEKTGRSIIAEGRPVPIVVDLRVHGTAEEACNRIADAYDYEWHEASSGFLLFTKRFQEEQERPQIHPEELRASIHDMLAAMRAVYKYDSSTKGLYSQVFAEIINSMPREQVDAMQQGLSVPIHSLPIDLQSKATGLIYDNGLRQVSALWTTLEQMLSHLDQETIVFNRRAANSLVDREAPGFSAVFHSKYRHTGPVLLDSTELKNVVTGEEPKLPPQTANRSISNLSVGHNPTQMPAVSLRLGEVPDLFDIHYGVTLDVAPELKNREILLTLHKATAKHLLEAIADLYHWRSSFVSPVHYEIRRRQYHYPDNFVQAGLTFQQYMPSDIARFLLAISRRQRETSGYSLDTQPNMPPLNLSNYVHDHLRTLRIAEAKKFIEQRSSESNGATVSYALLPQPAREKFLLLALLVVGENSMGEIWRLLNHPASYQMDPFNSVLVLKKGYSIIGPAGDSITFRPITKIPTITIPIKK